MTTPSCCCADWIGRLARDHAGRLVAVARREGLRGDDALDAVQEAFGVLLARPERDALQHRDEDAARLLTAIVKNAARNLRRRHHRALPHRELAEDDVVDPAPTPERTLADAATAEQLAGCVAGLSELHRSIVTLRVLEEVSTDDAARTLGLTPGHVAVLLHRARKQLEHCMTA